MSVSRRQVIELEGFEFADAQDAKMAEAERKKADYLHAHLDYDKPENVLAVYQKSINEQFFKTPIGLEFIRYLQNYLKTQPSIKKEDIIPIPLYMTFHDKTTENDGTSAGKKATKRIEASKQKEKSPGAFYISVVLNIALVIAVISMFVITLKSDNPNILNYETALINKYSYWEQDLNAREKELRQEELEWIQAQEKLRTQEEQSASENQ